MNDILLQKYVNKLTKNHIIEYAKNQNIELKDNEVDIIYDYIKKYWKNFYHDDDKNLLKELKCKLSYETYNKLEELYIEAKEKIKK